MTDLPSPYPASDTPHASDNRDGDAHNSDVHDDDAGATSGIVLQPIGVVRNAVSSIDHHNWREVTSQLVIDAAYRDGLQGLDDWSHIVVIYTMHSSHYDAARHLLSQPDQREDMPRVGIFAQRARFHPNTLGMTAVAITSMQDGVIDVRGLDAIDGTPILDIKPYAPVYDGVMNPLVPGWFVQLMQDY